VLAQDSAAGGGAGDAEYEERYKRLNAMMEDLLVAQATLQKRVSALADELQSTREEIRRDGRQYAQHEDLRKLAEKLSEIDRKREDDKRLILEEIRKLAEVPMAEPPSRKGRESREPAKEPVREPDAGAGAGSEPQRGYEYVVKSGDTISAIVAAYQQSGVKVTVDQVLKANPKVDPKRIPVGKTIFIPDPAAP